MEPITVDLGGELGSQTFSILDELEKFAREELMHWTWITNIQSYDNSHDKNQCYGIGQYAHLRLSEALSVIGDCKNSSTQPDTEYKIKNALNLLQDHYIKRNVPHRNSSRGIFISQLRKSEGDVIAVYGLGYLTRNFINLHDALTATPLMIRGIFRGHDYEINIPETIAAEREALISLRATISSELGAVKKETGAIKSNLHKHSQTISAQLVKQQTDFEELKGEKTEELENIKKFYSKSVQYHEAVNYWKLNAWWHGAWASVWFLSIALAMALLYKYAPPFALELLTPLDTKNPSSVPISHISLVILFAGLAVWALRLLVRFMLSSMHLATDSRERMIMTKTYIALTKEGAGLQEDDRKLIFSLLFHRAATGFVKDDAAPSTGVDLLTRLFSGQK